MRNEKKIMIPSTQVLCSVVLYMYQCFKESYFTIHSKDRQNTRQQ
jgi:hypothetical protein